MKIVSYIEMTIDNPIPEWKGVDALPEIITITGEAPPLSGAYFTDLPFHCAETYDRTGGVENFEHVKSNIYDDQE
jgi:hypothetical protein